MVRSLYESLCNMESIYADRAAIRYFDETSAQVVEIPYRRYAADLRRFVAFVRSKNRPARPAYRSAGPQQLSVCDRPVWFGSGRCRSRAPELEQDLGRDPL